MHLDTAKLVFCDGLSLSLWTRCAFPGASGVGFLRGKSNIRSCHHRRRRQNRLVACFAQLHLQGIESTVSTLLYTLQQMETKASEGRNDLHQKVDALRAEMTVMGARLATATKDIAAMKPTVDAVESVAVQATGVRTPRGVSDASECS